MIRNWFRKFMIGRYGPDQYYIFLFILALVIIILATILNSGILTIISYAIIIYAMFRLFSRNIEKRRQENDRFIAIWWPIRSKISARIKRIKSSKTHKFFKCPGCKNVLRVPKGKGRIQITCPKCGERFEKKT